MGSLQYNVNNIIVPRECTFTVWLCPCKYSTYRHDRVAVLTSWSSFPLQDFYLVWHQPFRLQGVWWMAQTIGYWIVNCTVRRLIFYRDSPSARARQAYCWSVPRKGQPRQRRLKISPRYIKNWTLEQMARGKLCLSIFYSLSIHMELESELVIDCSMWVVHPLYCID